MPSLFRLLVALGVLGGLVYGAIFALANLVEPKPREITVTIPQDRFAKPRRSTAAAESAATAVSHLKPIE